MEYLKDFRSLDFLEQIAALGNVEAAKQPDSIPELCALYLSPVNDDAVDTMVRNTLRAVLLANQREILRGLEADEPRIRQFCVGMAGDKGLVDAAPQLMALADSLHDDPEALADVLMAMSRIKAPAFRAAFHTHARHADDIIAGLCLRMLGEYGDPADLGILCDIIAAAEGADAYETCAVTTYNAILGLGMCASPDALAFLVEKLHHKNPTARRIIHETLVHVGPACIEYVAKAFDSPDTDARIMAANVLGFIGDKAGASVLIQAMDKGAVEHPNLRFAVFEALGKIPNMTSLICLIDALVGEHDEVVLMAVVTGLENQMHPAVVKKLVALLNQDLGNPDGQGQKVVRAIAAAKAVTLFKALFCDEALTQAILTRVASSNDDEAIAAFRAVCEAMDDPRAASCVQTLAGAAVSQKKGSLLAIDDSTAMRNFYRSAGSSLGYEVVTAEHGREALTHLEFGTPFDVIVVDMNMPVMDGIEFTEQARTMEQYAHTPIVMATTESTKSQAVLARNVGVTTFLKKPFTADVLQHKLKHVLGT
ncbi:MAG: HEAT repeat domain-containing protein [Desulfovibrionaceae bacterium]